MFITLQNKKISMKMKMLYKAPYFFLKLNSKKQKNRKTRGKTHLNNKIYFNHAHLQNNINPKLPRNNNNNNISNNNI